MTISKPILTTDQTIVVAGKVLYTDKRRRIHIKKPIRDLFEKNQNEVGYIMELCLSEDKTMERIKELREQNIKPVILYFTEEAE